MEKQMVQCEDGRRRQARVHGVPRQEGEFKIWNAGVRLKGKHVSGEAWYSYKTKTWYFLADPEGKVLLQPVSFWPRQRLFMMNKTLSKLNLMDLRREAGRQELISLYQRKRYYTQKSSIPISWFV